MSSGCAARYVGIVADGSTDREIIGRLAKCLLNSTAPCEQIFLQQSLGLHMRRFALDASRTQDYRLCAGPARVLRNGIITVLYSAVTEFKSQIPTREASDSDLLVLQADAETHLTEQTDYFDQEWALAVPKIFLAAIEQFYHTALSRHQYQWEQLPLIVPLVLFPSTDILVAAAKTPDSVPFRFRGLKAKEIKKAQYGVNNLDQLAPGELEEKALDLITPQACRAIYRHIPESRIFLRTLSWNEGAPSS